MCVGCVLKIGHGFGLGHTDEVFDNADTGNCLDYSHNPGANLHPGQVNFERLQQMYTANNNAAGATRRRHLRRRNLITCNEDSEDQEQRRHRIRLFQLEYDKAMNELHHYLLRIDGQEEENIPRDADNDNVDDVDERWIMLEYHDRGSTYQKSFKIFNRDITRENDKNYNYNRYTLTVSLLHP